MAADQFPTGERRAPAGRWPFAGWRRRPVPPSEIETDAEGLFGAVVIRFAPDRPATLAGGSAALDDLASVLGAGAADPSALLAALAESSPEAGAALAALTARGRSCDLTIPLAQGGRLRLQGRSSGALAWLRLERDRARDDEGLQAAFDAYPQPAWIAGRRGEVLRANRAFDAADTALAAAAADLVAQSLSRRAPAEAVRTLALGGAQRTILVRTEPIGADAAVVWTLDVTSGQEVVRVRERLDLAFDLTLAHLTDAVGVFDPDQRLVRSNGAFARLWGLEPAWLAERPRHGQWLDRLRQMGRLPETADYAAFKAAELARHGGAEPTEVLWTLPQGETLRMAALPHPEGGLVLVFSDVTAELQRMARFNQLVQVQQASLDKLTDAVAVFGADARLRLHNEAFQILWSLPPGLVATGAPFDRVVERAASRLHDLAFWRALKTRITDPDPALRAAAAGEAQTGDGRWLAWQSLPLPDGATLVSFADVTSARDVQRALAEREAALEAAERLKSDFVAAVSRELRVPLTTVLGYAELLEDAAETVPHGMRGWIGAVRAAAGDLARSVEDILAVAELDAGERRLSISAVDLAALVDHAAGRRRAGADRAGVVLESEWPKGVGAIAADAGALALVLDKLIDNALAQTPAGGRIVVGAQRDHGEICLTVADTGRGIPFDVQARLFERYAGIEGGGAGLGLALVRALVELHGGWVSVESEPGRGARLTCHLPETPSARD
jgi:signal transduction histidine kinase